MEKRTDLHIREAISTNLQFLRAIQEDANEIVAREKEKMRQRRLSLPLAYFDFRELFRSFGTACLHNRDQNRDFIIDKDNEAMIEQLYFYSTDNSSFDGDLNKGIMLQGKYGCGKTLILETYSQLTIMLFGNMACVIHCSRLSSRWSCRSKL